MQSSGPFCGILIQSLQNKILGKAKECIAFMCTISWLIYYIKKKKIFCGSKKLELHMQKAKKKRRKRKVRNKMSKIPYSIK